jgi:DUF1680 family protein
MEGKKPYSANLDGHCCLSSGPRGIALISTFAVSTDADGVVMNLYDAGTAKLSLRDGTAVVLTTDTLYPGDGRIQITVNPATSKTFAVKLRIPAWCRTSSVRLNGREVESKPDADGYVALKRTWHGGDKVELNCKLEPRVVVGDHKNEGKAAVLYGPLVLAADEALLTDFGLTISNVTLAGADLLTLNVKPEPAPEKVKTWPGAQVFSVNAVVVKGTDAVKSGSPVKIRLIPFADAGGTGSSDYRVWLPLPPTPSGSLLHSGK